MRISDILAICWRNLTRRKLRTFLTALGVVIGVALIMVGISIGIGLTVYYDEMLAGWGDLTVINIYNYSSGREGTKLDDAAVAQIQAIEGVDIATPFYQNWEVNMRFRSKDGRYEASGNVYGVYPEALEKLGYKLKSGEYLKEGDREYSIVAGEQFAYNFWDTKRRNNNWRDPYPDEFGNIKDPFVDVQKDKLTLVMPTQKYDENGNPSGKDLEVTPVFVGILEKSDQNWEATNSCFMDITEMKALIKKYNKLNGITKTESSNYEDVRVKCVDIDAVAAVQEQIEAMGFNCYSMNDSREQMQEQALVIQLILGGLAGFSLLVAAIGIANTMVMAIYERTREIGIMKVIGTQLRNIRLMFLMESGMIGLLGGVLGVLLSFGGSWLLNTMAAGYIGMGSGKISIIPVWLMLLALGFSILVGVIFGFLPANRAVKISALEAIKHD